MESDQLSSFLWLLVQGLLLIAIPIVIAAAFQHFRVMSKQLAERAGLDEEEQTSILNTIRQAVRIAEETGILNDLIGPEKKKIAIDYAQQYLEQRGVRMNVEQIAGLIENEVKRQFTNPTPPEALMASRQQLISSTIEAAVLAAEQSGLQGLIDNIGTAKKAYAVRFVQDYLGQFGLRVDEKIIEGLIEAQLLRVTLAAKGQLPPPMMAGMTAPAVSSQPTAAG